MCEYGFEAGRDYEVIVKNDENPMGGRPATNHMLTPSMAKELCMLQRTDKGREAGSRPNQTEPKVYRFNGSAALLVRFMKALLCRKQSGSKSEAKT